MNAACFLASYGTFSDAHVVIIHGAFVAYILMLETTWNESDDQWFDISAEVQAAGGSVTTYSPNSKKANTVTVTLYDVSVDFAIGSSGVKNQDGKVQVRADTFYRSFVYAATEMVFIGAHEVKLGIPTGS